MYCVCMYGVTGSEWLDSGLGVTMSLSPASDMFIHSDMCLSIL